MSPEASDPSDAIPDAADELLAACLDCPAEERAAALEDACRRRPDLAAEVRERVSLLEGAGLLDGADAKREFPERLGDFRLLECLGGGGMGVVYLAEQVSLGREVALKLIRPEHLYFPAARERFRREVEAVAGLQHPGIVPIYTVGEEGGVPFFAMERIRGCTVAEILRALQDMPPDLLDGRLLGQTFSEITGLEDATLFAGRSWTEACFGIALEVARALRHAHEHGILHRDLKPSNIMLSSEGRAMLIDFGLASRAGSQKITRSGSQLGSLAYMSPEQVRGEAVDASTDVYSLGVTLYEMLSLRDPYGDGPPDQLPQRILGGAPPSLRHHNRRVPPDAETVCLVAMESAAPRRYRTVGDFAADLERFLEHRPIQARRTGPVLRARRWIQRHPTTSVAVLLGSLLVVGLPVGLLWKEIRAREAIAEEAETANRSADFLVELFEQFDPERARGRTVSARELLALGSQRLRASKIRKPRIRARLFLALAETHLELGLAKEAKDLVCECLDLHGRHPELPRDELARATALFGVVLGNTGDYGAAEKTLRSAVAMSRAEFGDDHQSTISATSSLGRLLAFLGEHAEAEKLLRDALARRRAQTAGDDVRVVRSLINLGTLLELAQRQEEAEPVMQEALAMLERLEMADHPLAARVMHDLAVVEKELFRGPRARELFEKSIALYERIHGATSVLLALPLENYGSLLQRMGDLEGAERSYRRALDLRRAGQGEDHPRFARSLNQLASVYNTTGRHREALKALEHAVAVQRAAFPDGHRDLAIALMNLARTQRSLRELKAAADHAGQAQRMFRRVAGKPTASEALAVAELAIIEFSQGRVEPALAHGREAVELCDELASPDPGIAARCRDNLAFLLLTQRQSTAAERYVKDALAIYERALPDGSADVALAAHHLGWALEQQRDHEAAERAYRRALDLFRRFVPGGNGLSAFTLNAVGAYAARRQEWTEAQELLGEALSIRVRLLPEDSPHLAMSYHNLGTVRLKAGNVAEAEPLLRRAVELRSEHLPDPHHDTGHSLSSLGEALVAAGEHRKAVPVLERCLAIRKKLLPPDHALVSASAQTLELARAGARRR